jgi:hypothetical protein
MMRWSRVVVAGCLLGGCIAACVEQDSGGTSFFGSAGDWNSTGGTDAGIIYGDGGPSTSPMLVKIDPNATMDQTPGQGVGVFTQYDSATEAGPGGQWYVWWTCDTSVSSLPCDFTISVSVAHGGISNISPQGFGSSDQLVGGGADGAAASSSFTADTTTTTRVQGVKFDTEPGAVVTLSAALEGEYSGAFLFFVQDGQINGGYNGELTDPLDLQSTSP